MNAYSSKESIRDKGTLIPSKIPSNVFPFKIGKDVEVTDREMRQRFQIGTEEGPSEDLDVPPQGDGPEVDNCWFWFANGGYFSPDYPVNNLREIQITPSLSTIFLA